MQGEFQEEESLLFPLVYLVFQVLTSILQGRRIGVPTVEIVSFGTAASQDETARNYVDEGSNRDWPNLFLLDSN